MKKILCNIIVFVSSFLWSLILISPFAWGQKGFSKSIVVAVIDTGVDVRHPLLKPYLWRNLGEQGIDKNGRLKSQNGIDDDGNGFVDDVHGWNFAQNNSLLKDKHGHGTHISGIIVHGKRQGQRFPSSSSSLRHNIKIMGLKYFNAKASGKINLRSTIAAIDYAVKMGANIINYSGGGTLRSLAEKKAIRRAKQKGVLFVAAAGNEGLNSDHRGYFPAGYELANIISVGSIGDNKKLSSFSNYGHRSVDIAALGENIYSTMNSKSYGLMTGTSQATAFVSRAAALMMSAESYFQDFRRLIPVLVHSGDFNSSYRNKIKYQTSLNIENSLKMKPLGVSASGDLAVNIKAHSLEKFVIDEDL